MKINLLSRKCQLLFLMVWLTVSFANAATITSAGSGNWSTGSTWVGGVVPLATDNVIIVTGHTITVTAAASITNISLSATTSKLVINTGQTLTVTGTFANLGTTTNGVNGPGNLLFTGTATFGSLTPTGVRPNVIIGNGISTNTVTLSAPTLITDLTINTGATLNSNTRALNVTGFMANNGTISGTTSITTLTGNFTNNGTVNLTTGQVNIAAGNFTNTSTGIFNITSTGRITTTAGDFSNAGTITYTLAGRLYLGGDFVNSGTFTLTNGGLVYFIGTANQSIQGFTSSGTVNMIKSGGTATFTSDVTAGGLTLAGVGGTLDLVSGTHTFNGTLTRTNGTLNCGSSLLRIGASVSAAVATVNAGTGTVEYYRAGNQTAAVLVYNNLILSGSGTKTFAITPTVNGKLTMAGTAAVNVTTGVVTYGPSATLQYDTTNVRNASSEEWVSPFIASGGVIINGVNNITLNADKVFGLSSPLTITNIGKLAASTRSLTFGGDFINSGGTFTSSGPIVIANTMATQSISGFTTTGLVSMTKTDGVASFTTNVSGGALAINGVGGTLNLGSGLTHTFTGAVALTNGILNGGSSTLNANSPSTVWQGTGSNFVAGTGTVRFGAGTFQTLATASIFNNLTFSGSGLKTLTGIPTVNGILSMEGTATVSAAPTYGTGATLQYNTNTGRTSGVEWITPFAAMGGVFITNTGTITANAAKVFNATAPLIIDDGATLANGDFAISGGSTLTVSDSSTLQLNGTSTFPSFTTTVLGPNSTVEYNGTAQAVAIKSYGNLLLSNTGNKTFAGTVTIAGDLEITGSAVAILFDGTASSSSSLTFSGVLQTTLGSWGGTGSAAANLSATWFGSATTGVINVLTSCLPGAWLGLTNTDWNTGTNWCGGSVPTATTDVSIGVNSNQPIIGAPGGLCRNITIKTGATLTVSGSNTLAVKANWTNNGTFTANTSTVNFNGTTAQTIGGSSATTFNTITNSNTTAPISAAIGMTVKSSLNIANAASVLDLGSFALTDGGTFSNSGSGHIKTSNTSGTPIPAGKTWNNSVTYSNATGGQTIVAGTYNGAPSLELDNTSGTQTASGNIITGGQLNINNGGTPTFDMGGFNLTTNALNILAPNSVLDMRAGILTITTLNAMDGKVRFSGATNAMPFASGTVEYYGAAQTVASGNYNSLLFSGTTGVYSIESDIDVANTLNVNNGAVVTVQNGFTLSVEDAVTVTNLGTLIFENNASLLQTSYTGANTGNVIVKRNTTPILKLDSTFWSSPTTGIQTLLNFSPDSDTSQFYTYNSENDTYTEQNPATTVFGKGIGYSIRAPENTSTVTPTVTPFQFEGVPNNGTFTIPLTTPPGDIGLSLIGNPYPSALNADDFINENLYDAVLNPTNTLTGTYYFWSHNSRLTGNDFSSDDYYTCNLSGPTGYTNSGTGNNALPTGYIASGQGFFVENHIAGDLKFNNSMRETKNNTNFYRTKKIKENEDLERHRIWLDLTNSAKTTGSQTLVGYIENATNGYDLGYDSHLFDDTRPLLIYSMLGTDTMAIQGRTLPFLDSDTVPIGYFTKVADNVTITTNRVDGLFLDDQGVYLEDKLLNVIHNIKEEPYTFASAAGTFNDRFVLLYSDGSLANKDFDAQANKVLVAVKNKQIKIKSLANIIEKVVVYDLSGKQIYQNDAVNSNEFIIANLVSSRQTLIVKTTLENGKSVLTKVLY